MTERSKSDEYEGTCPRCGSPRWISVSLDGGWTRRPQCVPCGTIHSHTLGIGTNHPHYGSDRAACRQPGDCTCDRSGARTFCMHHLQEAFDALEAMKGRYPNPIAACGFYEDGLLNAVADTIPPDRFEAVCARLGISPGECATSLFIDGLMMGVLVAAIAPTNHAARIIQEGTSSA